MATGDSDKAVGRRDYTIVDDGVLVNVLTGELPDVYGQFWWLDRLRPGVRPCRSLRSVAWAED